MHMKNKYNRYGYKVCYRENGAASYVRHFKTYTYKQALRARAGYMRYPPTARSDGHTLKRPRWKIIHISRSEVKRGIWREVPF